jgi:hypothetical protein
VPATRRQPSLATAQSVPFEPKTAALLAAGAKPFHWDEVVHYASEGAAGSTMLFADIERTDWVKTAKWTAQEGELVISWDSRPHSRVTWAQPVAAQAQRVAA